MRLRRFVSFVVTMSISLSLVPAAVSFAEDSEVAIGTEWKFDFGAEGQTAATGYKSVTPTTEYRKNIDGADQYGLIGSSPEDYKFPDYEDGVVTKQGQYYSYAAAGEGTDADDDRIGIGVLPETTPAQIEGLYPIRFSMAAENNAYYEVKVTVAGFDSDKAATATVYSEKRHPIITNKNIAAGDKEIVEFTATPQKVLVKDRTNGGSITYNDNKLNVEVVGENIAISSIEVKKVEPKTAIWCYDDSTGCDYAMSLPYFPLQNYGGTAQYLSKYLSKDIALVNQGDGGIAANALGYFNCAKDNIKEGDYIYMQYGHNHKKDGPVGYVTWLHYYYEHAHEKGAKMVFVGPIDRHKSSQYDADTNTFNSTLNGFSKAADYYTQLLITRGFDTAQEFASKAKAKGGWAIDDEVYAWADTEIAKGIDSENGAKDVAFIDLNAPTLAWLSDVCEEVASVKGVEKPYSAVFTDYYFQAMRGTSVDGTHENDYGADFTASFFFDGAKALVNKESKTDIEKVEAELLTPLLTGLRTATPDKVSNDVITAGNAPNNEYPEVFKSANIKELPIYIKDVAFNADGTIKSVKVLKQEANLKMDTYGVVKIEILGSDKQVKGTIYSSQVDNTWSDGSVSELTEFTGDTAVKLEEDDDFTAVVYRAPDGENWPEATITETKYSDAYVPTDIDGALITNEDGLDSEDFNYYTAIYEGENISNLKGNNGWGVYGNGIGSQKFAKDDDGRCYVDIASTSTSFAVTRKFDSNAPKVGTSGVIEMNVDLKYVSGYGTQFMLSSTITTGSPWLANNVNLFNIGSNGKIIFGANSTEAGTLSTTDWTTVNYKLNLDTGKATVKVGDDVEVTDSIKEYDTIAAEVIPKTLAGFGVKVSSKSNEFFMSNLSFTKYKDAKLPEMTVTVSAGDGGTAEIVGKEENTFTETMNEGSYTIKATPNEGYEFVGWVDGDGKLLSEEQELNIRAHTETVKATFQNDAILYSEDFEGENPNYSTSQNKGTIIFGTDNQDISNHNTTKIYGMNGRGSLYKVFSPNMKGKIKVSLDFRLDASKNGSTVSLLLGEDAISSSKDIQTTNKSIINIAGSANSNKVMNSVTLNGMELSNATVVRERYDGNDSSRSYNGTGWLNLTATIDFKNHTEDVKITRISEADNSDKKIIYNQKNITLPTNVEENAEPNYADALGSIIMGGTDSGYQGVYLDNIVIEQVREDTPEIQLDTANKKLTGFTSGEEYTVTVTDYPTVEDDEESIVTEDTPLTVIDDGIDISDYIGGTVTIIKNGQTYGDENDIVYTKDSFKQKISLSKLATPENLTTKAETSKNGNDGKIKGVTADMEYILKSAPEGTAWTKITAGDITNEDEIIIAPGEYLVRYAGTENSFESDAAEVIVEAYIEKQYTVTYSGTATGGTYSVTDVSSGSKVNENTVITIVPAADTANGYVIDAVYAYNTAGGSANEHSKLTDDGAYKYMVTADTTIEVTFKLKEYDVVFDSNNGAANTTVKVSHGQTAESKKPANPEKQGYHFLGWVKGTDTTVAIVTEWDAITSNGTVYTAKFEENAPDTVTVIFNAGEGAFDNAEKTKTVTINKGATLTANDLPSVTPPTGYTFNGWGEITGKAVNESVSYTAEYTIKSFTITWSVDGVETTEELNYGATPSYNGTPTKAEDANGKYSFTGWLPAIETVSKAQTYTAQFDLIAKYAITYETDDGTINDSNYATVYYAGEGATLPTDVTKNGYTFAGWYDNDEFVGEAVTTISTAETGNKTYYANWTLNAPTEYLITFVNWDNTELQKSNVAVGTTPQYTATTPTKAEDDRYTYEFIGWTPEIANVSGIATYKAEFKQYIKTLSNIATIEKVKDNGGVNLIITPTQSELQTINLYVAIYNADGSLKSVGMTPCTVSDNGKIIVPLTEPSLAEGESYKLMLWDISQSPLITAITNSDSFFN